MKSNGGNVNRIFYNRQHSNKGKGVTNNNVTVITIPDQNAVMDNQIGLVMGSVSGRPNVGHEGVGF